MEIYLVGGAVRDALLGLPVTENDWVVVGATPAAMLQQGYKQVGKDFPVFLHPSSHEEYALARVERKTGRGYTGFDFDASPQVTLTQDLSRRDLTINAIAKTLDGKLIDPYHGQADLKDKILRHVSPAFAEDPVRILRVARFAARFAEFGFTVAPETNDLMKTMVTAGEVDALVAERVWKELSRALVEKNPEQFFFVLENCDALRVLFPQFSTANFSALARAAALTNDPEIRFAVLCHGLSVKQIEELGKRYRVPGNYIELALLVANHQEKFLQARELSAEDLLTLLQATDAFRREPRFKKFLATVEIIAESSAQAAWLTKAFQAAKEVNPQTFLEKGAKGQEIADLIRKERIDCIRKLLD
ncbi:MAG: multifunctional CCA tRNA nucleotidyl transferase/2'3'-cyclic phosphodiesterase/2'nucleotidase/phosphatase [Pseudomonadota bacterium]